MQLVQDFIVPVNRFVEERGQIRFARLHGTGFFINGDGFFLTAGHVLRDAAADVEANGGGIGVVMRKPGYEDDRFLGQVIAGDYAPDPFDVALCRIDKPSRSSFRTAVDLKVWIWRDVHTVGYAESALSREAAGAARPDVRGLKGYVVRKLPKGHFLLHPHPEAFELSFPIPTCMSGSPLVMLYDDPVPAGTPFPLMGVCVGSNRTELGDKGTEEYGLAHSLAGLYEWQPRLLGGIRLADAIKPTG